MRPPLPYYPTDNEQIGDEMLVVVDDDFEGGDQSMNQVVEEEGEDEEDLYACFFKLLEGFETETNQVIPMIIRPINNRHTAEATPSITNETIGPDSNAVSKDGIPPPATPSPCDINEIQIIENTPPALSSSPPTTQTTVITPTTIGLAAGGGELEAHAF